MNSIAVWQLQCKTNTQKSCIGGNVLYILFTLKSSYPLLFLFNLNKVLPHQRKNAMNCLAYETEAHMKDPIYGCVGVELEVWGLFNWLSRQTWGLDLSFV